MGLKVIVTGASSGIGLATALKFSKDGHEVFATARSEKKLAEAVRVAQAAGGSALITGVGDVGVEADVERCHSEAVKHFEGEPDVVVLNAGVTLPLSDLEDITNRQYDLVFDTNVRGVFLWLKAVLPGFKKRGSGQIIIINSVVGEAALGPRFALYTASKFAVTGLTQALRLELRGSGIKVGSIHPGVVDTNIFVNEEWLEKGQDGREAFGVGKASLRPEDVADAVATIAYQSSRSDIEKLSVWPMPFEHVRAQ